MQVQLSTQPSAMLHDYLVRLSILAVGHVRGGVNVHSKPAHLPLNELPIFYLLLEQGLSLIEVAIELNSEGVGALEDGDD